LTIGGRREFRHAALIIRRDGNCHGRPEVEDVIDAIYDAAVEPQLWRNALEKLGDRFGGIPIVTGLQPIPHPAIFAVSSRLDEDVAGADICQDRCATTKRIRRYHPGSVTQCQTEVP